MDALFTEFAIAKSKRGGIELEKMMGKGQNAKKSPKKEPVKTPKEKKADKKIKKAEKMRQQ